MPDAQTAADASARPHAAPPPSAIIPPWRAMLPRPRTARPQPSPPRCFAPPPACCSSWKAGRALDAATLRRAMSTAFRRHRHARRLGMEGRLRGRRDGTGPVPPALRPASCAREAGAGPDGPATMLAMLETLAALEPSQTRRSEEQTGTPAILHAAAARLCGVASRRGLGRAIPCSNPRPAPGCWP